MSKVKTRKEINEEMEALAGEISTLRESHAEQVKGFESTIEGLKVDVSNLEKTIADKSAEIETAQNAIVEADAKAEALKVELAEKTEALAESEVGFAKAKAALQNPAFADASIVPCEIDQKHEDAEADLAEGEAFKEAEEAKTMSSEKFRELSPESQNQFFREGGKIKED
jgi:chromosome segregation ATPase